MLGQNKGQYQDICTHWLKFQDNFKIQDNFRITLKFQEFQDCWDPWKDEFQHTFQALTGTLVFILENNPTITFI